MSTLKVNKIRDTAGSADSITLDPNGGAVLAGITTVSTLKATTGIVTTLTATTGIVTTFVTNTANVGGGVTISESGIEASGIGITCANINGGQISGRRNIIINGAMMMAQRGTSSTTNGIKTVDRFRADWTGTDEAPTQAQVDLSSSDTPYTLGFRKSFKITNGNQTSGAGAGDYVGIDTQLEAQDIANSGWNYTSTSSFVTLSFWVKSSVAQNFYGYLYTFDGTSQIYPFETGSLTADTWTKITKTIPGNSNLTFNNDNGAGLLIQLWGFIGTTYTDSGVNLNQWAAFASGTRTPDNTSTWYTTNDATLEMTGVQLEVGSQATSFEHRSFAEELALCQRYFWNDPTPDAGYGYYATRYGNSGSFASVECPVTMRTTPTATGTRGDGGSYSSVTTSQLRIQFYVSNDTTTYVTSATISADAEL